MRKHNFKAWHFESFLWCPLPGRWLENRRFGAGELPWLVWLSLHVWILWLPVLRSSCHRLSVEVRDVDCPAAPCLHRAGCSCPLLAWVLQRQQHRWLCVDHLKRRLYIRNRLKWLAELPKLGFYLLQGCTEMCDPVRRPYRLFKSLGCWVWCYQCVMPAAGRVKKSVHRELDTG